MIKIEEVGIDKLEEYDSIEFSYSTNKIYELKKINNGLGGFLLEVKDIEPFTKKFEEDTTLWKKYFDLTKWKFFIAYDNDIPVGGAILAIRSDRPDSKKYPVLWDLRVIEKYRYQGIGKKLFDTVKESGKKEDYKELKIECQNTNYPAVNFYYKQGAILRSINDHAYDDFTNEVQMFWYLNL